MNIAAPAPDRSSLRRFRAFRHGMLALLLGAFFLPVLFALNPAEAPENYIVTRWDTETGLPHNAVRKIFQTRDGYLWIGTQQGLARFDGLTFTIFNQHNTPSILNGQVTSLAETSDGSLWIGTSYGLIRHRDGQFRTYLKEDGVKTATGTVNTLCVAPDGALWIGTQDGITRWVDERFVHDIDLSAYDTRGLRSISVTKDKTVWVIAGAAALRYRNGKFTRFDRSRGLVCQQVQSIVQDAAGRTIAVTADGLFALENEQFRPFDENRNLSSTRVNVVYLDRAGNLWIGTLNGLDRYAHDKVLPYLDQFGHRLGIVDAIFEDAENCLWVGTSRGLIRLTDRRGYSLSSADQISGTLINAVTQSRDGAFWVACWGAGVDRFSNGEVTHFGPNAPLSNETVTCLYEDPSGVMWFGTRGSSIERLEGTTTRRFVYESGVATSRPVTSMYAVPGREFLVGISKRGLLQLVDGRLIPVPEASALTPHTVWLIRRLQDGRLVIGTSNGLYERQADRSWRPITIQGVFSPVVVRDLLESPDGTIWLATDGRGLVRWRGNSGASYGVARGMVDDTLFSVRSDGLGFLWVSSSRGIARIRESEFEDLDAGEIPSLNCITFGRDDGLLSGASAGNGFPTATVLQDGRVVTATDNGVAVIEPRRVQSNTRPPTVLVETVSADDHSIPVAPRMEIPAGTNRIEIRYTALSLLSPHRLRFRYQLEGSDPTWVEAGRSRSATYTHLAPGDYTFSVLACNSDGVWNETGASIVLHIQPQFHQTVVFRSAAIACALALLTGFVGWRMHQLRRKEQTLALANAELDQRVRARTAELSKSNDELKQRESLFRLIFEHAPVGISWHRTDLGAEHHYNAAFRNILGLTKPTSQGASYVKGLVHPDDAERLREAEARIDSGEIDSYTLELRFVRDNQSLVQGLFATAVVRNAQGHVLQVIGILEDITARKHAEMELAKTYKRMMELSRASGMAEVATGVLHNVGNVLNSVNVSVSMLADGLRQSKVSGLAKLSDLLGEHASNLAGFLADDPRGQRVLPYIARLAEHLQADHARMIAEVETLRSSVEHIKAIVARQQNVAQQGGLLERVSPADMFNDALEMNAMALGRHNIEVVCEYETTPPVIAERHKVLQVLINLIQNAKDALKEGRTEDRKLCARIKVSGDTVQLEVADNGIGIAPENLSRIFEHGFTTRPTGHGFGLHSSAITAKQLNGSLRAYSDGRGLGARFVLELPISQSAALVVDFGEPETSTPPSRS